MVVYFVIQEVDGLGFWSSRHRAFKGWLYADKFTNKPEAIKLAKEDNVGVCRITTVIDTKYGD